MKSLRAFRATIPFVLATGLFLSACATTTGDQPKWVAQIPSDNGYLYFVGVRTDAQSLDEGKRSAVKQAITELTEHFEIHPQTRFYERKTELETRVLDEIESHSANVRVKGALLKDWYFEKTKDGRYDVYVLIQYPKEELEREKARIKNEVAEKVSYVKKTIRQGIEVRERGDVNGAFIAFVTALKEASEIGDVGLHSEAVDRLRDLIVSVQIKVVSGNDQKGELYKGLKEPLIAKVSVKGGSTESPASNLPVIFQFVEGEGILTEGVWTDSNGLAYCQVSRIRKASGKQSIRASLDFERMFIMPSGLPSSDRELVNSYLDLLRSRKAEFAFETVIVKKNLRVIVLVREENLGIPADESMVGNELAARLVEAGYQVIGDHEIGKNNMERISSAIQKDEILPLRKAFYYMADIIVTGTIKTRKGSNNLGWAFSSHADVYIKAINLGSGKVITQQNIIGVVGFGETEERAGTRALEKVGSIVAEDIANQLSLWEEAKDHENQ